MPTDEPSRPLPLKGYVRGIGKVRILRYAGNDRFYVLDPKDEVRLLHRDRIIFTKR